jgi:hypothetical protein
MAWSDAARKAALEARRMHAHQKKMHVDHLPIVNTLGARPQIAADLRAIRSGTGFKSYASKSAVMEMAVKATNLRNFKRQAKAHSRRKKM